MKNISVKFSYFLGGESLSIPHKMLDQIALHTLFG